MPKRICDVCGKETEVHGGKTCENGHFVCAKHVHAGMFSTLKTCPICGKSLR